MNELAPFDRRLVLVRTGVATPRTNVSDDVVTINFASVRWEALLEAVLREAGFQEARGFRELGLRPHDRLQEGLGGFSISAAFESVETSSDGIVQLSALARDRDGEAVFVHFSTGNEAVESFGSAGISRIFSGISSFLSSKLDNLTVVDAKHRVSDPESAPSKISLFEAEPIAVTEESTSTVLKARALVILLGLDRGAEYDSTKQRETWGRAEFFQHVSAIVNRQSVDELEEMLHPPSQYLDLLRERQYALQEMLKDQEAAIHRTIEFPPELKDAGITLLGDFAKYLEHKVPDVDASVRITQDGLRVTLEIETPGGNIERVEHTLEEYGLVVTGRLTPEDVLSDPLEVLELRNSLRIAQARLESTRDLLAARADQLALQERQIDQQRKDAGATSRAQNRHIKTLEAQNEHLRELLAAGLVPLPQWVESMVERVATGAEAAVEISRLEAMVGESPPWDRQELIRDQLEAVRDSQPEQFGDFSRNVTASVTGGWFVELVKLIVG